MAEKNGKVAELPGLQIFWHADKTDVTLHWSPEIKTYEFLEAMIDMAKLKIEDERRMVVAQRQLVKIQEQQQAEAIAAQVHRGR